MKGSRAGVRSFLPMGFNAQLPGFSARLEWPDCAQEGSRHCAQVSKAARLVDADNLCCYLSCYIPGGFMPKFATVRDLKNQTTALIREAETGKAVVVTRRGKPVATLKPFEQRDVDDDERFPTQAFDALKKK